MDNLTQEMQAPLNAHFSVDGSVSGSKSSDAVAGGVSIFIDSLAVREEADINRIAQQLYQMEQKALRKKGLVYV